MKIYDIINEGPKEWIARKFADRAARKAAEKSAEAALKAERELVARELEQYAPHIEDLARQYAKDIIKAEKRLGERPLFRDTGTPPGASPIKKDWLDDKAPELAKKDPAVQEAIRRKIKERADELEGIHTGRIKPETKPPEPEVKTEPKVKKEPEVKKKKKPDVDPEVDATLKKPKGNWGFTATVNALMLAWGVTEIVDSNLNSITRLENALNSGQITNEQFETEKRLRIQRMFVEISLSAAPLGVLKYLASGKPGFKDLALKAMPGGAIKKILSIATTGFWVYLLKIVQDPAAYTSAFPQGGTRPDPNSSGEALSAAAYKDGMSWIAVSIIDPPIRGLWKYLDEKSGDWLTARYGEYLSRDEANKRAKDSGSSVQQPPESSVSTAPPAAEISSDKQSGQDEVKPGWQRAQDDDDAKAAWEKLMGNK